MFDSTYIILVLPALLFSLWASWNVKHTFKKYSKQISRCGYTGASIAREILDKNGLRHVPVERVPGELTDHFDPKANIVRLSESVYSSSSTSAIGVAAHEVGHAIQYAQEYKPMELRAKIIPLTTLGSKFSMPLLILGLILSNYMSGFIILAYIGVILFGTVVLFQLFTLPTEFDASKRAMVSIESMGRMTSEEIDGSRKVLRAAALTYVAALAVSLMQFIRFFIAVTRRR